MAKTDAAIGQGDALAELIDQAVTEAEEAARHRRSLPWSEEEDRFLMENWGRLSEAEIAERLGRTASGVQNRRYRKLGMGGPSRAKGFLPAAHVGQMLGKHPSAVRRWIERGWLPARRSPTTDKAYWHIRASDLKEFVAAPEYFMLLDSPIVDEELRHTFEAAREGWDDEWLTLAQATQALGLSTGTVLYNVHSGKLPAVRRETRKSRWWILGSRVIQFRDDRKGGSNG